MCSILLSYKKTDEWLWQIAANRDESFDRAASPPKLLNRSPLIVGGQDLQAGGTWFAINPTAHMFAGLTNLHEGSVADWQGGHSRGHLIPHMLATESALEAKRRLEDMLSHRTVNHFMMLFGDPDHLFYAEYDSGSLSFELLQPGSYVLCNTPMNASLTPKMKLISRLMDTYLISKPSNWSENAQFVLRQTELPPARDGGPPVAPFDALNVRTEDYGTRSALIATCHMRSGMTYLATEGNPSNTPFVDVTKLLREQSEYVE